MAGPTLCEDSDLNGEYDKCLVVDPAISRNEGWLMVMDSSAAIWIYTYPYFNGMPAGTHHTVSFLIVRGSPLLGLVRDYAPWDQDHSCGSSEHGWFMSTGGGSLWGHGYAGSFPAGIVHAGQTLTLQVNLKEGWLRFWYGPTHFSACMRYDIMPLFLLDRVDGQPHGPGRFSSYYACVCSTLVLLIRPHLARLWE
jgi:hypothetical protein